MSGPTVLTWEGPNEESVSPTTDMGPIILSPILSPKSWQVVALAPHLINVDGHSSIPVSRSIHAVLLVKRLDFFFFLSLRR